MTKLLTPGNRAFASFCKEQGYQTWYWYNKSQGWVGCQVAWYNQEKQSLRYYDKEAIMREYG